MITINNKDLYRAMTTSTNGLVIVNGNFECFTLKKNLRYTDSSSSTNVIHQPKDQFSCSKDPQISVMMMFRMHEAVVVLK